MSKQTQEIKKDKPLKTPSLWQITKKTWIYNIFWGLLFIGLFFAFWTIDDVAFELDWFLMYGLERPRWQLLVVGFQSYLALRAFFKLCNCVRFSFLAKKHIDEVTDGSGYKKVYEGTEGTGKTFNATNDAFYMSFNASEGLRFRYFLKKPFSAELEAKNDVDWQALKQSYAFYEANKDKIPNLSATYDIEYCGRKSYDFNIAYLDQKKRPPESLVVSMSETANLLPNSQSRLPKDEKKDTKQFIKKNETLGYCRQWFDMRIIADEQRGSEIFLGLRALFSSNIRLTARKKVMRAKFLDWILSRLYAKIMKKGEKNTAFLSKCYINLSKFNEDIGFYQFSFIERDPERGTILSDVNSFIVPCDVPFVYDSRGERSKYPLLANKPE
ncbi:MAG: hypothetical protein IKT42_04595 [Clostridia bacterium]|nr:hypothetical protein [Clostridia bacterium]